MHKHLKNWLSGIIKKKKKGVPCMLPPRRRCLEYSKVYSDVTEKWFLVNTFKNVGRIFKCTPSCN